MSAAQLTRIQHCLVGPQSGLTGWLEKLSGAQRPCLPFDSCCLSVLCHCPCRYRLFGRTTVCQVPPAALLDRSVVSQCGAPHTWMVELALSCQHVKGAGWAADQHVLSAHMTSETKCHT